MARRFVPSKSLASPLRLPTWLTAQLAMTVPTVQITGTSMLKANTPHDGLRPPGGWLRLWLAFPAAQAHVAHLAGPTLPDQVGAVNKLTPNIRPGRRSRFLPISVKRTKRATCGPGCSALRLDVFAKICDDPERPTGEHRS
jgi:hypothetical protein